ncbi:MAG: hypothetical protein K6E86_01705 [Bacteroidales bacterium]|nr:hypothetical protein [Bacteroidales bacterium]
MKQLKTYICPTVKFVDVLPERSYCDIVQISQRNTNTDEGGDVETFDAPIFREGIWDEEPENEQ